MALPTPDIDVASLFKVEGLVAVITGGGSGKLLYYIPLNFSSVVARHLCGTLVGSLS